MLCLLSLSCQDNRQRIVLKECPYEFGCIKSGCLTLVANDDTAGPCVFHITYEIMNDRYMITTAHPSFSCDIGLMEEVGWVAGAAVTFCPLPEPERNWRISFDEGTSVGDNAVTCSMQFNERDRAYRMAATWYCRICTGDSGKCGDTSGKFAGQHIRHTSSVRETSCVYSARINAPCRLQVVK